MITGFNTDIRHNDKVYHIQTEDKGLQNPYIESLVYVGGAVESGGKAEMTLQEGASLVEERQDVERHRGRE